MDDSADFTTHAEKGRFALAARMAVEEGRPADEVEDLRARALWQMAAVFRNAPGTRKLAEEFGMTRDQVLDLLEREASRLKDSGNARSLRPVFDPTKRDYAGFDQWRERLMARWNKL